MSAAPPVSARERELWDAYFFLREECWRLQPSDPQFAEVHYEAKAAFVRWMLAFGPEARA
jgi:hypothetical protein